MERIYTSAKKGEPVRIKGSGNQRRDHNYVTDHVAATTLLMQHAPFEGEVYNVGSGFGYSLREILDTMIKESGKKITVKIDPSRLRKNDIVEVVCDNKKIRKLGLGFRNIF